MTIFGGTNDSPLDSAHPLKKMYQECAQFINRQNKHGLIVVFPIHKFGFLPKVKEIKLLRGGGAGYAAQARALIDAETCPPMAGWAKRPFVDGNYLFFDLVHQAAITPDRKPKK